MSLERAYRRLLCAYPARYRAERGEEMVSTYLDLTREGQARPSAGDVLDVLGGAGHEWARAARRWDAAAGLRLAATPALAAATMLAGLAVLIAAERVVALPLRVSPAIPVADRLVNQLLVRQLPAIAWLAAALLAALPSARATRAAVAAALALTLAPPLLGGLLNGAPLIITPMPLVQGCLGLVSLALPHGRRWPARLVPVACVALVVAADALGGARTLALVIRGVASNPAVLLAAAVALAGVGLAWKPLRSMVWALAIWLLAVACGVGGSFAFSRVASYLTLLTVVALAIGVMLARVVLRRAGAGRRPAVAAPADAGQ